jgi:hypothetical protein
MKKSAVIETIEKVGYKVEWTNSPQWGYVPYVVGRVANCLLYKHRSGQTEGINPEFSKKEIASILKVVDNKDLIGRTVKKNSNDPEQNEKPWINWDIVEGLRDGGWID